MTMLYRILVELALVVAYVTAETHTISFDNLCGYGTPTLVQNGIIISVGASYVLNASIVGATAYLQTGSCGLNGDGCTVVETTLSNPTCAGCFSTTDISLIPPFAFSVTTGFHYYNGCDTAGADCDNPECSTALHTPTDTQDQVLCELDDVNLLVTFCS